MKLKNLLKNGFVGLLLVAFMASCSTSSDVVSSNRIQKRKYNKGFHLNIGKKDKSNDVAVIARANRSTVGAKVNSASPMEIMVAEVQEENIVSAKNATSTIKVKRTKSSESTTIAVTEEATTEIADMSAPVKENKKEKSTSSSQKSSSAPVWLIWVLAILLPFVGVGLVTDWDITLTLIALGLTLLFWVPGVIFALIVVNNNI